MNGSIKKKMDGKNFGFITPEEGDKDLFFHASNLVDVDFDDINEGDAVTFDVEEAEKGPAAVNLSLIHI